MSSSIYSSDCDFDSSTPLTQQTRERSLSISSAATADQNVLSQTSSDSESILDQSSPRTQLLNLPATEEWAYTIRSQASCCEYRNGTFPQLHSRESSVAPDDPPDTLVSDLDLQKESAVIDAMDIETLRREAAQWEQKKAEDELLLKKIEEDREKARKSLAITNFRLQSKYNILRQLALQRLPTEILSEIFQRVLDMEEPRYQRMPRVCPWNVSLTCRRWRSIVLQIPRLWAKFSFDLWYRYPGSSIPLVKLALERAKNVGLDIAIDYEPVYRTHPIMDVFITANSKWKKVSIKINHMALRDFSEAVEPYSRLEELRVVFPFNSNYCADPDVPIPGYPGFRESRFPALKHADIHEVEEVITYRGLTNFPFRQLESLSVDIGFFQVGLPDLDSKLESLQRLAVWNVSKQSYRFDGSVRENKLCLPSVKDLTIMAPGSREALMNLLELPAVESLTIDYGRCDMTYCPTRHPDLHRVKRLRLLSLGPRYPEDLDDHDEHSGWYRQESVLNLAPTLEDDLIRLRNFLDLMTGVEELYLGLRVANLPGLIRVFDNRFSDSEEDIERVSRLPMLKRLEFFQQEEYLGKDGVGEDESRLLRKLILDVAKSRCMRLGPQRRGEKEMKGRILFPESWKIL